MKSFFIGLSFSKVLPPGWGSVVLEMKAGGSLAGYLSIAPALRAWTRAPAILRACTGRSYAPNRANQNVEISTKTGETKMLNFDLIETRASFDRLKAKGTAAANEQVVVVRNALTGLLTGAASETSLTVVALAAYGNPMTPKGKPITKLGGLNERNVPGSDAMRKALKAAFEVNEARQFPQVNAETGETALVPVPGAYELIVSFIDKEKGAPKGIHALATAVKALWVDAAGPAATASDDSADDSDSDSDSVPGDDSVPGATLATALATMAQTIDGAPTSELAACEQQIVALFKALNAASDRIAASVDIADAA